MANKKSHRHFPTQQVQRNPPAVQQPYTQTLQITYEAPLPPPHMLAEYERIMPGISERMVVRMEQQTTHRIDIEKKKINADIASEKKGQTLAFILAALAVIGSFYLIATGKDRYGIYIFITTFASLVAVFIVGKIKQGNVLARKRDEMKRLLPPDPGSQQ